MQDKKNDPAGSVRDRVSERLCKPGISERLGPLLPRIMNYESQSVEFIGKLLYNTREVARMKKILLLVIAVLVVALVWSWATPAKKDNRVSKTRVVALSAVSAFSPGIALLSIAYYAKRNLNARGENAWFLKWLWLFWIVAFIDVTLDKIPGAATINQVVEYLLIWFVAWVGATVLNSDVSMLLGGLAGSGVQLTRQAYHAGTDYATLGVGAPVRSTIEDIATWVFTRILL